MMAALAVVSAFDAGMARAAGYQVVTQSTSVLGSAQAGMTAGPYDLTRLSLNPAALGLGSGLEIAGNVTGISTSQTMRDSVGTTTLGTPLGGGTGGDSGGLFGLPSFYAGYSLDERTRIGLGVTSYFGLGTKWDAGWQGRYYAGSSSLAVLDITPVISFRPAPSLIIAGGPVFEYTRTKTNTTIDFGTLDTLQTGGAFGGVPGGSDGSLATRTTSWAAVFILGATYEPLDGTRVGLAYRSELRHGQRGTADFTLGGATGQALAAASGAFADTNIRSGLDNPATFTFGLSQQITPALTFFADARRTFWSSVKDLTLSFENPANPQAVTVLDLRDSWFLTQGGRYQIDERFAIRAGAAYDAAATRTPTRGPILAENTSYWLAAGLEAQLTESLRIDFAIGHRFMADAPVSLSSNQTGNEIRGNLRGTARTSADFAAIQVAWRF
jgi:long-chain fatty acid transport protein